MVYLNCQDIVWETCPYVARAESIEEVIDAAMEHVQSNHNVIFKDMRSRWSGHQIKEMLRSKISAKN